MESETLRATDDYSASKATAPRVSLNDMNGKIVAEYYTTASAALHDRPEALPEHEAVINPALSVLTLCILVMRNGFTIIGKSAPQAPTTSMKRRGAASHMRMQSSNSGRLRATRFVRSWLHNGSAGCDPASRSKPGG